MRVSTPQIGLPCVPRTSHCFFSGVKPGGGQARVAMGDVSVIPHSWRISTSNFSSNAFISDTGTADPPHDTNRSDEMS